MADPELVKILQQGSDVWNDWREQQPKNRMIDLRNIDLSSAHLSQANLNGAMLTRALLIDADLSQTNLQDADLSMADLGGADLSGANLSMANLSEANVSKINLTGADLSYAILSGIDLTVDIELGEAHLTGANLSRTDLSRLDLSETDLSDADLSEADLSDADLGNADLSKADLRETILSGTILSGTILSGAYLTSTVIADVDLRKTRGLAEIVHVGPSIIELQSTLLPQDGSALLFLRGCGVPDEWIDLYRAQMMHPIQYHSCFISYAHQDDDLTRRLHADLQDKGVRSWFAPHDMHIGDKIRPRIDEAIHLQDKLLLILSENSVVSDWVEHEVETALAKERREKRTILFPIRLDNTILDRPYTGWAATVQNERHIGDFTGWKNHDRYQIAFDRLMRDLKKSEDERA